MSHDPFVPFLSSEASIEDRLRRYETYLRELQTVVMSGVPGPAGPTGPEGPQGPQGDPLSVAAAYPIDSIFWSKSPVNPAISLGIGTWVQLTTGAFQSFADQGNFIFRRIS